jgi:hypothetical protein
MSVMRASVRRAAFTSDLELWAQSDDEAVRVSLPPGVWREVIEHLTAKMEGREPDREWIEVTL